MAFPKISIVTISYNSEKTIENTIRSIVSQEYQNREYIVVDGASTDGTLDIINRYSDLIDIVISEPDSGISNAFNKGISRASGDLIVLINSDDRLLPNALQLVADTWNEVSDIWSGNYLAENRKGERFRITPSLKFSVPPFFQRPVHQGRFISRKLYERIGLYDEAIRYPMDLDFMIRASLSKARFQYVDADVALFSLGGATSESIFKKRKDYIYLIRKNGGNYFQAYSFYLFLVIVQVTKNIMSCVVKDIVRKIRY